MDNGGVWSRILKNIRTYAILPGHTVVKAKLN